MFMGEYNHTIDAKGRLTIPSKLREGLGEEFVITQGNDGCLIAYDAEKWGEFERKLNALPDSKKDVRAYKRFFLGKATVINELDKQGRALLPAPLREYAGLIKDVVLVGVGDKVEIWSAERWQQSAPEDIDDIAERISDMGYDI